MNFSIFISTHFTIYLISTFKRKKCADLGCEMSIKNTHFQLFSKQLQKKHFGLIKILILQ